MKNVYYSLIYSHIIYAIEIWGSAFKTDLDKISILQKRVVRLMTFKDVLYFLQLRVHLGQQNQSL